MPFPEVIADYGSSIAPADFEADVRLLLRYVPERGLVGLQFVRLGATSDFPRRRRRAKTKRLGRPFRLSSAAGLYHRAWKDQPASIELFLDNIFRSAPSWVLRVPFFRHTLLASTLYHEIGHHIHRTASPEFTEPELVADRWAIKLGRKFMFRHYWYLTPLTFTAVHLFRLYRKIRGAPAA